MPPSSLRRSGRRTPTWQLLPWSSPENFNAGYVMRSQDMMFKQGDREPWTHMIEHAEEVELLPKADLDDGLTYR